MQIVKNRTLFFALAAATLTLGAIPLGGCGYLNDRSARTDYAQYQAAMAAGDLRQARRALLRLTRVKQDVAEYWIALGQVQIQLDSYRQAYSAFNRAHELDRTNVPVLASMAQLALLSGDLDLANEQARSLALLSPDNPAVILVRGYTDLRSGNLDKAEAAADTLLADSPDDSFAKVLKARVLVARDKTDEAIALMEAQHRAVPNDLGAIRALSAIYRSREDWRNLARIEIDAHRRSPQDRAVAAQAIEASLRAGDVVSARQISTPYLSPKTNLKVLEATLEMWALYAPPGAVLPDAPKLANAAAGDARVSFANYFNDVAKPAIAEALLGSGRLPVTPENARFNAVLAQALSLQGKADEAKQLFDRVLDREPDQSEALRGRSMLETRAGMTKQAVIDAQRLVIINPKSGKDRLLLAQVYRASGNRKEVLRTLWEAFQDLPEDEIVVSALQKALASAGDADGKQRLTEEYADRRKATLTKELS